MQWPFFYLSLLVLFSEKNINSFSAFFPVQFMFSIFQLNHLLAHFNYIQSSAYFNTVTSLLSIFQNMLPLYSAFFYLWAGKQWICFMSLRLPFSLQKVLVADSSISSLLSTSTQHQHNNSPQTSSATQWKWCFAICSLINTNTFYYCIRWVLGMILGLQDPDHSSFLSWNPAKSFYGLLIYVVACVAINL